jgi:opine dehydrogenase
MLISTPVIASSTGSVSSITVKPYVSLQSEFAPAVTTRMSVLIDGDAALAVSCLLAQNGHAVRVCALNKAAQVPSEYEIRTRHASVGSFRGKVPYRSIETDLEKVFYESDALIISSPATGYGALVEKIVSHLRHQQTILLVNAPLGAGMQFAHAVKSTGADLQLNIVEMGTLFDCAKVEADVLLITGLRDNVSVSANKRNEMRRGLFVANAVAKGLVPSSNSIERGLSDVERMLRPTLLVAGMLGGRDVSLDNIQSWLNPSLVSIVSRLDAEIQGLARVFKGVVPSFSRALREFAINDPISSIGVSEELEPLLLKLGQSMFDTADGVDLCTVNQFVKRDIVETLMLIADFARLARYQMPVLQSVIQLGEVILGSEFAKEGRKLEDLGLVGFDIDEIVELFNA